MRRSQRTSERSESGIALIIVMISILVLASLAGGFAIAMKVETTLARNAGSETELEWLGRSGVEYARWILAQQAMCQQEPYDALSQVWAGGPGGACATNGPLMDVQKTVTLGRGTFTWKITDCESKYNVNSLLGPGGEDILHQAFTEMGIDPGDFPPLTGAILDWIDPDDDTHQDGAESSYYQTLSPPYYAKNGPIDDVSELLMVRGITQDMYWGPASTNHQIGLFQQQAGSPPAGGPQPGYAVGLADLFTAISSGKININTASSAVFQLIPGIDPMRADAIVAARQGEDDGSGMVGPYRSLDPGYLFNRIPGLGLEGARALSQFATLRSTAFEVQIDAQIGNYKRTFKAVLGRNAQNPRDIQILSFNWQ
ncbi:MAG TPA: general secretion pathway protein GspK [Verrucomicrobiae bacterium]|nr:general secretion pathway protein GspK [Verrucomicrobiae bacterium]